MTNDNDSRVSLDEEKPIGFPVKLLPEEPPAGPWKVQPIAEVIEPLINRIHTTSGGPAILGIDGRSSSGKTTLARRFSDAIPNAGVVHTDDIAWHHSIFGWDQLLAEGILRPARRGLKVSYRPPAWDARSRPGAIEVPENIHLLIVEGVGTCRRDLAQAFDALIWVQSDTNVIDRRNATRVAAGEISEEDFREWMQEEVAFLAEERPWERADFIVSGTPDRPHDPATEFVIADP